MAIQASDGPWMKNPSGRREEAAPGWGGPYASPGAAARGPRRTTRFTTTGRTGPPSSRRRPCGASRRGAAPPGPVGRRTSMRVWRTELVVWSAEVASSESQTVSVLFWGAGVGERRGPSVSAWRAKRRRQSGASAGLEHATSAASEHKDYGFQRSFMNLVGPLWAPWNPQSFRPLAKRRVRAPVRPDRRSMRPTHGRRRGEPRRPSRASCPPGPTNCSASARSNGT